MPKIRPALAILAALGAVLCAARADALQECRLLRQPDIHGDKIVFVYAGDLWTVARAGGLAIRITSHQGNELFPKFSPDGRTIAFTGQYDGNTDVYTIPADGGEPRRLTWHPGADQVAAWYPDGKSVLFRSARASAPPRYDRFFRIPAEGGFEEMLPLPFCGEASFSPDGSQLAYVFPQYDRRTWKRYQGGSAPDIWTFDFRRNVSQRITDWKGADEWPMWYGHTLYYTSDRGGRTINLWAYDTEKRTHRQVTNYDDYDLKSPSLGGDAIVFEKGGYLFVMDLPGETPKRIQVWVPDDKPAARAEYRNVSQWITEFDLSPSAKRAVIAARGDLFTVPAEKGDVRVLVGTPGSRERDPAWSPDGKWVAYLSDQSGEYEIWVVGSDGKTPPRQVTTGGTMFRFPPRWSPDSKKIAFSDKAYTVWWCDVASGRLTRVDRSEWYEIHDYTWSPDSKWLAYSKPNEAGFNQLALYSLDQGRVVPASDGMTNDFAPAFDPDGKYLYFISARTLAPQYGPFENDFQFDAVNKIYALTLQDSLPPPLPVQSDEEGAEGGKGQEPAAKEGAGGAGAAAGPKPLRVDVEGLTQRVAAIPVPPGHYGALAAFKGKLVVGDFEPPSDDDDTGQRQGAIKYYDLDKREMKTVLSGASGYALSKDGGKVLYQAQGGLGIVDLAPGKNPGDGKIAADPLMTLVDPRQEWAQMFQEAWRLERDFYYDPKMGGLDWKAVGERYRQLLPYVAHRADLDYLLGELQGELSTSHTYVYPTGDLPRARQVDIGLLGADYELDAASGLYRFKTVYRARDWNSSVEAPLGVPGVLVHPGDYLLSVNGRPVRAPMNVYAAFEGTAGKQIQIAVGRGPQDPKPRTYTVKPVASEASIRYTAWVAANREKVARATGGRVGYIHIPDTATQGIQEFAKQFYPQVGRQALIVDERFNGGGNDPYFYVSRLARRTLDYWAIRDARDQRTPSTALDGPKCILINQFAGSGGDAFPHYFRLMGIGPVIGERSWGGLVGYSRAHPLMDGGLVTVPDIAIWDPVRSAWIIENHGVDPDIEVENTPEAVIAGHDAQLERGIEWTLQQLNANPPVQPTRPPYKVQEGLR
ncbi:MAG TPA: S41 family peptidase [Candidatus Saccharimonadales bacterium]|nr:S41 family peptidase [Candidatus Saccharimonadales bacterium]